MPTPPPMPQMFTNLGLTRFSKSPREQADEGCLQLYGSRRDPCALRRCTYHLWSNTMVKTPLNVVDGGKCNAFWRLAKLSNDIYEAYSDGRTYYIVVEDGKVGQYEGYDDALSALAARPEYVT